MPWGLERHQDSGDLHFVTFSCYRRLPYLNSGRAKRRVEAALESARCQYGMPVFGYVVMPEHVHLLVAEPLRGELATAIQSLKQSVARRLISGGAHFWQRRYYDFNVCSETKRVEKLRYMHRNPVKRGFVEKPEDWEWSSFCHYATGCVSPVELESPWTEMKRRRAGIRFLMKRISGQTFGVLSADVERH
jgi:putative transposase